jgi:N2-citryl-N6-acetyl-N6-hydroxylysine synthase
MNLVEQANHISLRSFLNSFLRDYGADSRVSIDEVVRIKLLEGMLIIPFKKKSLLGFHHYTDEILLNHQQIDLFLLAKLIYKNFSKSFQGNEEQFAKKVLNSRNSLIHNLDEKSKIAYRKEYVFSEQSLYLGHPFHPYPKLKLGMTEDEQKKYSPEFRQKFKLVWIKVSFKNVYSNLNRDDYKELINLLVTPVDKVKDEEILIPMHPWQWEKIKGKFSDGDIIDVDEKEYTALSSMRTLFHPNSPYQLKFSMDVTLTNSQRHLQKEEVFRGNELYQIIKEEKLNLRPFNIKIQYEPYYIALKDNRGEILKSSFVQFRENTFWTSCDMNKFSLLSSLCERGFEHYSIIKKIKWFECFLKNIFTPFVELYGAYGILLGAHMQNILVEEDDDGVPVSVIFRDCQGSGFTTKAFQKLSKKYKFLVKDNGNILNPDEVNKVFGYYLVVNTVFSTISAISNSESYYEQFFLSKFRNYLVELKENFKNEGKENSFITYLLESDYLYQKGNFRCCLNDLNENTIENPWEIYNKLQNPLRLIRQGQVSKDGLLYKAYTDDGHEISLYTLKTTDIEIFYKWHQKDFVKEFWELDKSRTELLSYIEATRKCPYKDPMLLYIDGQAAGYFESYWAFEDRIAPYCKPGVYDRGIHLLIGEEKFLRKEIVIKAIYHVSKYLLDENPRTQKVWGEPRADNSKILKIAHKLPGWKAIKEFDFPHKRAMLLECDKTRFYAENDYGF